MLRHRTRFSWLLKLYLGGSRFVVAIGVGDTSSGEYLRRHRFECAAHFDVLPFDRSVGGWLGIEPSFNAGVLKSISEVVA